MFLKKMNIWNFRKYGINENNSPGLTIMFNPNFNLLIGENDAGKSAIIDAIKLTLGTSSEDNFRISENDFHINKDRQTAKEIKIECLFSGLSEQEAGIFLEWLTFDEKGEYELRVRMLAKKVKSDFLTTEKIEKVIKAGPENASSRLEGIARELLRSTYLKPLRDAEIELKPGVRSRLAQILKNHQAFRITDKLTKRPLEEAFGEANKKVENFFDDPYEEGNHKTIKSELATYLDNFFHQPLEGEEKYKSNFQITEVKLNEILKKLSLLLDDIPSGLGSLNLLFIAAELLLHDDALSTGPNITLIEEVEAHLHPQAQLRLIKYLQRDRQEDTGGQFILTTHSTTLAASTRLQHILLLHKGVAYPMNAENTELQNEDYKFLERFLDSTKANLFFAKGIIFVEGDAENLLLPVIAEMIGRPLHRYGVSIVNIGNTAFNRYVKIYSRSDKWLEKNPNLEVPVSVVTDVDIRPIKYYEEQLDHIERKIFVINESNLPQIASIMQIDVEDLNVIINQALSSKTELFKLLNTFMSKKISATKEQEISKITEKILTAETIESLRTSKESHLKNQYGNETNIKVFVASKWTLEYELAMSCLRFELLHAIHNTKYKHPNSPSNKQKLLDNIKEIEEITNDEEAAYKIYLPMFEKKVSKAAVSQELAIIIQNKTELIEKIKRDESLSYLRDAIYHVTGGKD